VSALVDLATLPLMEVWGDDVRARKLEGEAITMAVVELAPGAVVPEHHHHQEQLGICIQGSVRFRVGDEVRELGPGGTWRVPPDTPHQVQAGPDGAIAIDVFSPIRADWDFPELEPSPPRWPPSSA
jgi:quercetin dioxygenase-like cupin family protein